MGRSFTLLVNSRSGSYDPEAIQALCDEAGRLGCACVATSSVPDEDPPDAGRLEPDHLLAIFAGDGTVNRTITTLYGWGGAVLVLPGGTMNLLSKRLHGEKDALAILAHAIDGAAQRVRPNVIRTNCGDALAGVMAGPGTSWNEVREAMRDANLSALARGAVEAFGETATGARIALDDPSIGRAAGYPMIDALPRGDGLHIDAYHADDAGEFVVHLGALLTRNFRNGPCESFGPLDRVVLRTSDGQPMGLMLDGEPVEARAREELAVARCEVDLLATATND